MAICYNLLFKKLKRKRNVKMIFIHLKGGIGNQLFQYALYEKYKYLGKDVYMYDDPIRNDGNQHNGIEISRVFGIDYKRIPEEIDLKEYMKEEPYKLYIRAKNIIKTLTGRCHYEYDFSYKANYYRWDNCFLDGYWQSPKYFEDISDIIRHKLCFVNINEDINENIANRKVLQAIEDTTSVSVHVRRGDYLLSENENTFGNICTLDYYKKAVDYLKNRSEELTWFIFSDDIDWCMKHFDFIDNKQFVVGNRGKLSYLDMYLMSKCKYNIVANSSFSWWGAWLNKNPNKIVIAPNRWINNNQRVDIWDKDWIRI